MSRTYRARKEFGPHKVVDGFRVFGPLIPRHEHELWIQLGRSQYWMFDDWLLWARPSQYRKRRFGRDEHGWRRALRMRRAHGFELDKHKRPRHLRYQ